MIFKKTKLNESIEDNEPLARYIFSKKHFSVTKKCIKMPAFLPVSNAHTVSVIRHKDCTQVCLLKIGKGMEQKRGQSLKAVASLSAESVRSIESLDVQSDTSKGQHRRHSNITGFSKFSKPQIKQKALKLAEKAQLLMNVNPSL